ncbi:MAG: hypothetical protein ACJAYU_000106 [Bradymonadia bacterium]|jgi:hypothetical protein
MKRLLLLSLSLTAFIGCKTEVITQFPRTDVGADTGTDVAVDTVSDAGADTVADVAEAQLAGRPCEVDADCGEPGWQCANRQLLDNFGVGPEIDLPGGMCTRLLCTSNEDCGEGGTCFDASALGAPVQICFASCERLTDCRWEENYGCFPLSTFDEELEGGACLSASLEVAILCDDGTCEEEAQ